jgi:hypothetical protein
MTINTPKGEVTLVEPEPSRLRNLRRLLPLGAVRFGESKNGAQFGIVMKCGVKEVYGVKQQPVDIPEDWAERQFFINSLLVAHTVFRSHVGCAALYRSREGLPFAQRSPRNWRGPAADCKPEG